MRQYNKYLVKKDDIFDVNKFPAIREELGILIDRVADFPSAYKADIVVSFLKDHSLHNDWITANPRLTDLLSSGVMVTGSIESLFESCRENAVFLDQLKTYIKSGITPVH